MGLCPFRVNFVKIPAQLKLNLYCLISIWLYTNITSRSGTHNLVPRNNLALQKPKFVFLFWTISPNKSMGFDPNAINLVIDLFSSQYNNVLLSWGSTLGPQSQECFCSASYKHQSGSPDWLQIILVFLTFIISYMLSWPFLLHFGS